jgi:hypothetical protein
MRFIDRYPPIVRAGVGTSRPWPSATLDKTTDQLRCFDTRHDPANLFRRHRRHHFGGELETFAKRRTGRQTPHQLAPVNWRIACGLS